MSRILTHLKKGADVIGGLLFLVMFGAFVLQVFTRYILNQPLGWTEEMCKIGFLWFVFWGSGLMVRDKDQVRFDILCQAVPPAARRVFAILVAIGMAAMFLIGLPANADFVVFMGHDVTWILGIRFDIVFSVFIVFLVAYPIANLLRLRRLLGRGWKDEL